MNNKLMKYEELMVLLNNAKLILNRQMVEYLESIINLEFSVVKDNISIEERRTLNELQIYRSSLIYNINKRDVEYFDKVYEKNDTFKFNFYFNSDDVPSIKLCFMVPDGFNELDPVFRQKILLTKAYLDKLKLEYDLKDNAFTFNKKFVKKLPGLVIKKEIITK